MQAKYFKLILFLLFLSAAALPGYCADKNNEASGQYEAIRAKYLTLRNTDLEIANVSEWENVAAEFIQFADGSRGHERAPYALFEAAVLYEELYRKLGGKDRIFQSSLLLERIARDYPGHILVDDGLLKRGDFLLYEMRDSDGARRAYQEIVEAYPDTDMVEVAKARLRKIDGDDSGVVPSATETAGERAAVSAVQIPGKRSPIIVIDPGHGGEDFGAMGVGGLLEKDVVLSVALELESLLKEKLGAVVKLTRSGDGFVPLLQRTTMANEFGADIFISLHTNASAKKDLSGLETYYLDNSDNQATKKLAERENASTRFEGQGSDLQYMLSDLIQGAKLEDSIALANTLHQAVLSEVKEHWDGKIDLGVKKAPFYVLVGAHMPCVLVELFFVDHAKDGALLADRSVRHELALGLFIGVSRFLQR